MSVYLNSTDFLKLIAENDCCVVLERKVPLGHLKRDMATLQTQDGRHALSLSTPQGFYTCPVEIPWETVEDFLRASFLSQDGDPGPDGRTVFRLTEDGRRRALGVPQAAR